jgi:hypothetical protein
VERTIPDSLTRLYKYVSGERADIIEKRLIRYTQLGALNDPFEGKPHITAIASDEDARKNLREMLPTQIEEAYDRLEPRLKSRISFEQFSNLAIARADAIEPFFGQIVNSLTPFIRSQIPATFDKLIGVLSLSENPLSVKMWSHYAAAHTGFVIGFNAQHPYFDERKSKSDEFCYLRQVVYRNSRPKTLMTGLTGENLFLVKSLEWAEEREWRIMRALQDAHEVREAKPYAIHLFRFPADSMTEIILGPFVRPDTKSALVRVLTTDPDLRHVQLRHAQIDDIDFQVRIVDFAQ